MGKNNKNGGRGSGDKRRSFDVVKMKTAAMETQEQAQNNIREEEIKEKNAQIKVRAKTFAEEMGRGEPDPVKIVRKFVETEGFYRKK